MKSILAVLSASFLLAGCGGDDGNGTAAECVDVSAEESPVVLALDNEFDPSCLVVAPGQDLTVRNDGVAAHTFTIQRADINLVLQPGDEAVAPAAGDAAAAGEVEFVCEFHPEMVGTLRSSA